MAKEFNPLSADFQQNPYGAYKYLREHPALYVKELNSWWVGRYDDVCQITSQPTIFSNKKFHEISLGEFDYAPEATSLVACDPPEHTRLRKLAGPAFKPARLLAMADRVRAIVNAKLDPLLSRSDRSFDFQHDFAELVPIEVVAIFMNTDVRKANDFRRWSHTILSASQRASMSENQKDEIRRAIVEARKYFLDLVAERRLNLGEDLISDLIRAQEESDQLTDGEILSLAILLLNGGNETSAHLLGSVMVTLWDHPEQFELLKHEPSRIPDVVDEVLRYESPVQTAFLWTTQDVSVGGVDIPAESAVIAHWGSANRDERRFSDPDKFDITRKKAGHLAFGYGTHFCIGNMLGRQSVIIDLEQVLARMPNLRRADNDPIKWIPSYWVRGPKYLPVTF